MSLEVGLFQSEQYCLDPSTLPLQEAMDVAYAKVHFYVVAPTRAGQVVHVTARSCCPRTSSPEALPLVTDPRKWPLWKTKTPMFVPRQMLHTYQYSIVESGTLAAVEPSETRSMFPTLPKLLVRDVFGLTNEFRTNRPCESYPQSSEALPHFGHCELQSRPCIFIVCFHLPVVLTQDKENQDWHATWSESLIARTEGSVADDFFTHWIGTVSTATNDGRLITNSDHASISNALLPMNCTPLFLSQAATSGAYLGYCKQILWPSFHNVDILDLTCACWNPDYGDPTYVWDQSATQHWWDAYVSLNRKFCNAIADRVHAGDVVWVHDYHLMLLPNMLAIVTRDAPVSQRVHIIFFLHIPFPTSQIFRSLVQGKQLIHGIVGADVVGFHAFDHARHFLNACKRLMGLSNQSVQGGLTGVEYRGRTVTVVVRHVSIEPTHIAHLLRESFAKPLPGLKHESAFGAFYEEAINSRTTLLAAVDTCQRLSGIALKVLAFERFLWDYERWRGKVALVQYALREGKRSDDEERTSVEINRLVGRVNASFPGAVYYKEVETTLLSISERLVLWKNAVVFVATAIREGLNLAPFEYIFTRQPPLSPGLILASEFSATSSLLNGALRLNPFDLGSTAASFDVALSMSCEERVGRHARDLPFVLSRPSGKWTREILRDMWLASGGRAFHTPIFPHQNAFICPLVPKLNSSQQVSFPKAITDLTQCYLRSHCRVLLLDFGGTLVQRGERLGKYLKQSLTRPVWHKAERVLSHPVRKLLRYLSQDSRNFVYVVSAVNLHTLMTSLGTLPFLGLSASHGLCYSPPANVLQSSSSTFDHLDSCRRWRFSNRGIDWKQVIHTAMPILKWFTARTNGSSTICRETGIAWSYYRSDPEWGRIQATQLVLELEPMIAAYDVKIDHTEGLVEVVPRQTRQSDIIKYILGTIHCSFCNQPACVICVGDGEAGAMFASVYSFLADSDADEKHCTQVFTCSVGGKAPLASSYCSDHRQVIALLSALSRGQPSIMQWPSCLK
eukprot:CAMPEP_0185698610 /NCGR_PEP_ID=MMETSP1164-20130828/6425_1 /TAXON_ID=1104430 /ORGANISM="Chrysoreinhardia sp, Strain CCMP2950" /LENGTH=1015 /DNA_ID=CAMNT_0028365531 /DNA_START=79 /DNA_END=3126 /DNA_ORIENTATION=-